MSFFFPFSFVVVVVLTIARNMNATMSLIVN